MPRPAAFFLVLAILAGQILTAAENRYVDARLCAGCHKQIAESYLRTGMGRSFFRPAQSNTIEDYKIKREYYHALSDTHYSMVVRDGAYYQRRWQIGFGDKETNVEESRIDYVLGSGTHARSYLHRTPRGTLIELPLGWYQEKGGSWAMSPGFDALHPSTRRLASYECIFCHDGYPKIPAGHDTPGAEPMFTGNLPEGIDCQRCHGPGANHIAAVQAAGATPERIRASIVNPARLNPQLRMDICMQCHLEPTSTRIPSLIRRINRGPFSFVAGEPLEAFQLAFDHAPGTGHDDKFEIVGSSAYRLRKSRCFLATSSREGKAALTCDTCHDPHRSLQGEEAARHYTKVCRDCHAAPLDALVSAGKHPAANECTTCHMPKRRTEDVVHVVMTDHWIQRRPASRDLLAELPERHPAEAEEYHGEVVPYYPAAPSSRGGDDALYHALAQVAQNNHLRAGLPELSRLLAQRQPREPEWYFELGDAYLSGGEPAKAVGAYEQGIRLDPKSSRGLLSLAKAHKAAGQMQRAAETLERAVQLDPSDGASWYQYGSTALALGQPSEAIARLRKAISLDPDMPGVFTTLASVQAATGQTSDAAAALRQALQINPYDAAAWDLAGRTLAEQNQFPEAIFNFEKALRYRPAFGPYFYDYALTLASNGQFYRAEESAQSAVKADGTLPEPHALLGRILGHQRRFADAAREYREALRLRPDFAQARLDLASVLLAQGDTPQAISELRQVATGRDRAAAQIAQTALERLGQH